MSPFVVIKQIRNGGAVVAVHGPYRTRERAQEENSKLHQSFDSRDYSAVVHELTTTRRARGPVMAPNGAPDLMAALKASLADALGEGERT